MALTRSIEINAATYTPHALHGEAVLWQEKNCYVDVWIELVHALGCDPLAMLAFTVALDFEGDQFTFYKPKHEELSELYGIEVEELNVWRSLASHVHAQLALGKLVATEVDAFFLPDTKGTDYREKHTKTTIIANAYDPDERRLGYFHNGSYHELVGGDFDAIFRVGMSHDPGYMPFYAELVKARQVVRRAHSELATLARLQMKRHLARVPTEHPIAAFGRSVEEVLVALHEEGLAAFHQWAFATIRQLGSSMELLSEHLVWRGDGAAIDAAQDFRRISEGAKTLILKGARAASGKRPLAAEALLAQMEEAWTQGLDKLRAG